MIRALRDGHRRTFTVLTMTLPLLYLASVLSRAPHPRAPTPLAAERGGRRAVGETVLLLESPRLMAQLLADTGASVPSAVEVTPAGDPAIPDLLLYWAPTGGAGTELPPDAFLVGALRGGRPQVLPLPEPGMMAGGHFLLYSAVRREILGDTPLPATP